MLKQLSIQHLVLIDKLEINFGHGLCVLTGETGAGKSILLDALGLALGGRGNASLVNTNATEASISAIFQPEDDHSSINLIKSQGIIFDDNLLILRRVIQKTGKSRAFINDQPVTVSFLREVGETLIEIEGQDAQVGLLNQGNHLKLLDIYGQNFKYVDEVSKKFSLWRKCASLIEERERIISKDLAEEDYLRHVVNELRILAPKEDEEESLSQERSKLRHAGSLLEAFSDAKSQLEINGGISRALQLALKSSEQVADVIPELSKPVVESLKRAFLEVLEAEEQLSMALSKINVDPNTLDEVEERLFALRAAARKHNVTCDELSLVYERFENRLKDIEVGSGDIEELKLEEKKAREDYNKVAQILGHKRLKASKGLDKKVAEELEPLRLLGAKFNTQVKHMQNDDPLPNGFESVKFTVSTNKGLAEGPLAEIASGGERARFLLAIKVCLADRGDRRSLVFDEVDNGVGGAVADAVGMRLSQLAENTQVLVVTHSPQVAARAQKHFVVKKTTKEGKASTSVSIVTKESRTEEIARMISGAKITDEARAAADSLIEGGGRIEENVK